MNTIKLISILSILSLFSLASCVKRVEDKIDVDTVWVPIYGNMDSVRTIFSSEAIPTMNAGKIYVYKSYMFQLENEKGIHIYEQNDDKSVVKIAFINVIGASEISIKDYVLYTNNGNDIVGLDISDINNVKVLSRLENAFYTSSNTKLPPVSSGYFVCPDPAKGYIVGWEKKSNIKADCYF